MSETRCTTFLLGEFQIDAQKRLLSRDGQTVPLTSKAFDLLLALVQNQGREITKEELMERIWGDQIVEDANLTVAMSTLRKALGEKASQPRFIVTIPGRGYRFIGEPQPHEALIVERHTMSEIVIEDELDIANKVSIAPLLVRTSRKRWINPVAITGLTLLLVLTVVGIYWWSKRAPTHVVPTTQIKAIAILPFKPSVSDNRDESLEMGIADSLITRLSNIKDLNVPNKCGAQVHGPGTGCDGSRTRAESRRSA